MEAHTLPLPPSNELNLSPNPGLVTANQLVPSYLLFQLIKQSHEGKRRKKR